MSSRYEELERLQRLRERGALSDDEFQAEKRRVLGHQSGSPVEESAGVEPAARSRRRIWILLGAAALALAVLAGLLLGRTSGGDDGIVDLPMPGNDVAEDSNLIEAKAAPDLRSLPAAEQLARAFEAAFGSRGEAVVSVPGDGADEDVRYAPGKLLWAPFGPVLISEGKVVDAPHVAAGKIAAHYLKPAGDRFEVARAYPAAVVTGSHGGVGQWSVSGRFSRWPVVAAEGGGTWQGYTCTVLTLTELRPEGPAKVAAVPLSYDNSGAVTDASEARTTEGKVINIVRDQSFDIVYSGSRNFSEHYVRDAGGYKVAGGKSLMETC